MEQLHRLVAHAEPRQRDHRPQRRVRVLAAVLADARQVALDVAGIARHPIEGRRQQQHELRVAAHQVGAHGVHRALGAARLRRAREHGPRLRERVELALLVLHRSQRRAVVEIGAAIPVAVPGQLEHPGEPARLVAIAPGQVVAAAPLAERREVVQHGDQEPAEPHALAAAFVADAVHPVVPVARADERQAVRAVLHRVRRWRARRARRASADCGETARQQIGLVLVRLEQRRLEERHHLVEHATRRRVHST